MPYQTWMPFKPSDWVCVKNIHGDCSWGFARAFWWGYDPRDTEANIVAARLMEQPNEVIEPQTYLE